MARLLFDRRAKRVCAGLWGVGWLGVAALMLLPLGVAGGPEGGDLIAHFLVFGAMALAAVGFSRSPGQLAWLASLTVALGVGFEYAQSFLPYRSAAIDDAIADALGGLVGYVLALLVLYFVIRPTEPRLAAAR
jgi:hypothetical protein